MSERHVTWVQVGSREDLFGTDGSNLIETEPDWNF